MTRLTMTRLTGLGAAFPQLAAAVVLSALVIGCADEPGGEPNERADVTRSDDMSKDDLPGLFDACEEGFFDARLRVTGTSTDAAGGGVIDAAATYDGSTVAIRVELSGNREVMTTGLVTIRSVGDTSDAFLRALADAYGAPPPTAGMRSALTLAAVVLSGDPGDLAAGPVAIKVFHEPEFDEAKLSESEIEELYESRYAEAFVNIDVAAGTLEIAEKDEEYREPLIRALTAE